MENNFVYPGEDEFVVLPIHLMSNNYLFSYTTRGVVTSRKYYEWKKDFDKLDIPGRDYWENVDWNEPIEVFLHYVAKPGMDVHNGDKSAIDNIVTRHYHYEDSKVYAVHNRRVGSCHSYDDGEIRFFIRNVDKEGQVCSGCF